MKEKFPVILIKEEDMYVAQNPETGIASQGLSIEDALFNLKEAMELYFEELGEKIPAHEIILATIEV
jgi:predicted RNase H-like HicB family nuclease